MAENPSESQDGLTRAVWAMMTPEQRRAWMKIEGHLPKKPDTEPVAIGGGVGAAGAVTAGFVRDGYGFGCIAPVVAVGGFVAGGAIGTAVDKAGGTVVDAAGDAIDTVADKAP